MANRERGEVEVELEGRKYIMRPEFRGIAEAEDKLGTGITSLTDRFVHQRLGIKDLAAVIYGGLVGGGHKNLSFEDVGEIILSEGMGKFFVPAARLYRLIVNPEAVHEDEQKKAEPPIQAAVVTDQPAQPPQ